jgi:hypothetical protein
MSFESSRSWSDSWRGRGALLSAVTAGLLASWVASGAAETVKAGDGAGECPIAKKVSALLGSWRSAAAEAKTLPADEVAKTRARLEAAAKDCPVGSRMGETIGFVKSVLSHSLSVEESCAKHCPLAAAEPCAASEAKAARSRLLKDLDELAGHAACVVAQECSAKETASAKKSGTECAEGLAAKAAALKASWEKVPAELAAVTPAKREQAQASFREIAGGSKAVRLLPETVAALGMGFEAIESLNGKLAEWAKAHPEALKDVPEESRKAIEGQIALLHATGEVLQRACAAAKACEVECQAGKTETASGK